MELSSEGYWRIGLNERCRLTIWLSRLSCLSNVWTLLFPKETNLLTEGFGHACLTGIMMHVSESYEGLSCYFFSNQLFNDTNSYHIFWLMYRCMIDIIIMVSVDFDISGPQWWMIDWHDLTGLNSGPNLPVITLASKFLRVDHNRTKFLRTSHFQKKLSVNYPMILRSI